MVFIILNHLGMQGDRSTIQLPPTLTLTAYPHPYPSVFFLLPNPLTPAFEKDFFPSLNSHKDMTFRLKVVAQNIASDVGCLDRVGFT